MGKKNLGYIYCCECGHEVNARLTDGSEVYPHRSDLADLPFWKCDTCGNTVGCHHKTDNPTLPLGIIANAAIKNARQHIHRLIDPLWESGKIPRGALYAKLAEATGRKSYHTANIRTLEEAREVYRHALNIKEQLTKEPVAYFHHPESCCVFMVTGQEEIDKTWAGNDGCLCTVSEKGYKALKAYYNTLEFQK